MFENNKCDDSKTSAGYNISLDIEVLNRQTKELEIICEPILTFDSVSINNGRYYSFGNEIENKMLCIFQYGSKEVILDLNKNKKNNWGLLFQQFSTYSNYKELSSKCM